MGYFSPRSAQTGIKCPQCDHNLEIRRSCHEVHMRCPRCNRDYPLKDYINNADSAMESFLENVYLDRI